jgi:hypothetical protein
MESVRMSIDILEIQDEYKLTCDRSIVGPEQGRTTLLTVCDGVLDLFAVCRSPELESCTDSTVGKVRVEPCACAGK